MGELSLAQRGGGFAIAPRSLEEKE
jgi:hypothetical protein